MTNLDRWYKQEFEITDAHRFLAERINIVWLDDIEWGLVGLDPKRPFNNSDMPRDVAEILGWTYREEGLLKSDYERALNLHFEMGYVLKSAVKDWITSPTKKKEK